MNEANKQKKKKDLLEMNLFDSYCCTSERRDKWVY